MYGGSKTTQSMRPIFVWEITTVGAGCNVSWQDVVRTRLDLVPEHATAVGHVGDHAAGGYVEIEDLRKDILVGRRIRAENQVV